MECTGIKTQQFSVNLVDLPETDVLQVRSRRDDRKHAFVVRNNQTRIPVSVVLVTQVSD